MTIFSDICGWVIHTGWSTPPCLFIPPEKLESQVCILQLDASSLFTEF